VSERTNIVKTLGADERFTTMTTALHETGLDAILTGNGPFTVLAPTNDAFRQFREGSGDHLRHDPQEQCKRVLQYHILFGLLVEKDIKKLNFPKTCLGITVEISERAGQVTINGISLTYPDIICTNGVIHGIDTVLLPPFREPGTHRLKIRI